MLGHARYLTQETYCEHKTSPRIFQPMKHILVTGIVGFIGFHVAQALQARGDKICGLDNFNDYYSVALKHKRASLLQAQGIEVFQEDINNTEFLIELLQKHAITHVVHLAAQAGVRVPNPYSYIHSNLNGFVALLEALRFQPTIKLVYASSSSVYGLNTKVPFSEQDPVNHPTSFYGATKRSNELIAHSYHHIYGLQCTGLRFFTVYGPWGRPDMAYFSFARAIRDHQPIVLFEQGALQRDFTYIDDIVSGILGAIDLGAAYDLFNLGNSVPISVAELVSELEELLGKRALIIHQEKPQSDVAVTYAAIDKARSVLGFEPKTPLKEGLARFVDWLTTYE